MTKDVISLSISVLLLFRHYISHKITFGAPSSGGVLCSACGAFIESKMVMMHSLLTILCDSMSRDMRFPVKWYLPPAKAQTSLHVLRSLIRAIASGMNI